ncbi:dNTP triphosphohydrolase [Proteus vulgaris]|uniref:deoxyguanosinetriphosphate triphosphohydrolase family protein n=1 Tax=Proteus vulgaris TaxID=585 RepID=UPI0021B10A02|nr:dNTP triphosphohydrolase [Proteus vulgaris]MCT6518461.1 dNTP triphosphohydrolase [Proteus vulgaris]
MEWVNLLSDNRRKDKYKHKINNSDETRYELERDYDRILFCAPTRRLADKTQVFPLEKNDSVRTRLTHSYEVSNLARSIGTKLAYNNEIDIFDDYKTGCGDNLKRNLPALLAAIGLAHDLGNPPFGHRGERAMSLWFENKYEEIKNKFLKEPNNEEGKKDLTEVDKYIMDFTKFDGNAQTFRLVTQLQIINDSFGLNLTYATLASLIKYPRSSYYRGENEKHWDKHGFFYSEADIVDEVWHETGLKENVRHPLTYIMEACDDIAYSVLDAEDTIKKGLASINDLFSFLENYKNNIEDISKYSCEITLLNSLIKKSRKKYIEFVNCDENLTPYEIDDISMQMFRVEAIRIMINSVSSAFIKNHNDIKNGVFKSKDIISKSDSYLLCKALKEFDKIFGYRNKEVLKLEVEGSHYINNLMDMLWIGIHGNGNKDNPQYSKTFFGDYAYKRISENYRRVFENKENKEKLPILYQEFQLLADTISGMTDSYLISLHNELKPLYDEQFEKKRL